MKDDFGFVLAIMVIIFVCGLALGSNLGSTTKENQLINVYCQSIEYIGVTTIDDVYYCYDEDDLLKVEWVR